MKFDYPETTSANLWVDNGILFIRCLPKSIISRTVAEKITDERIRISQGVSYPVFMDIRSAKYITMDACNFLKQAEGLQFISAYAFMFKTHVHGILVNYFLTINPPALPTMPVSTKEIALNWLKDYKSEANSSNKISVSNEALAS